MIKFTAPRTVTFTRHPVYWDGLGGIAVQCEQSLELLNHWQSLFVPDESQDTLPSFTAFAPAAIPKILPNLFLLERLSCGTDWKVRLAGTYIADILERDITGLELQEIAFLDGYHDAYRAFCDGVVTGSTAVVGAGYKAGWAKSYQHFEVIHVPIQSRDENAIWILGGVFPIARG